MTSTGTITWRSSPGAGVWASPSNLWLSGGYNVFGFTDKDLSPEEYTSHGAYMRLRFKFDENLFSWKDPKENKTLPMKDISKGEK